MIRLITYNDSIDNFIKELGRTLNKHRVKFIISTKPYVKVTEDTGSNGYFCDEPKELAIAVGKSMKLWLPTLVHESCHFDQYIEKDPLWKKAMDYDPDPDIDDLVFAWIEGRKIKATIQQVKKCIKLAKALELNNEKRTYAKILKYDLPIDLERYAKRAGAYVSFYDFMAKHKKWYKIGKEPYNHPGILKLMPSTIQDKYNGSKPKLIKLFKECV